MKKIHVLMAAAATVATIASCEREQDPILAEGTGSTVSISMPDTKASLGVSSGTSRPVYWNSGDRLVINGSVSEPLGSEYDGESTAEFAFGATLATPYNILYPASIYKDAATVTLPAEQEAGTDLSFASGALPMYGYSTTAAMGSIHHLAGILQVNLTGSATIAYVQVTGGADEQMSGDFTLDYTTGALTSTSSYYADKRVKVLVGKALSSTATPVYVVLPAGTYAAGLTLRIVDSDGGYMDKAIEGSRTIAAGSLKKLPELEYASAGTLPKEYVIKTAAEWNAFISDYNEVATSAQSGTVSIEDDFAFDAAAPQTGTKEAYTSFRYTVYGNGHTISGLSTVLVFRNYGTIQDLTVEGTNASAQGGRSYMGLLVGWNNGTVKNCTVKGSLTVDSNSGITKTSVYAGAIAYNHTNAQTIDVTSEVDITFDLPGVVAYIGGVVGWNVAGIPVQNCTYQNATISVSSSNAKTTYIGGVIGYNEAVGSTSVVKGLYNAGNILYGTEDDFNASVTGGTVSIGGVVGFQKEEYKVEKENNTYARARNTGNITAYIGRSYTAAYFGGVFGRCADLQGVNNDAAFAIEFGHKDAAPDSQTLEVVFIDNQADLTLGTVGIGGVSGLYSGTGYTQNVINFNKVEVHGLAGSAAAAKALSGRISVGGTIGYVTGKNGKVNRQRNYGSVSVSLPYQETNTFVGGMVGAINETTGNKARVINNIAAGKVSTTLVQKAGTTALDAIGVGGIAGALNVTLDSGQNGSNEVSGDITVNGSKASNGDRYFGTLCGYGLVSDILAGTVTGTMTVYGTAITATDNLVLE